MLYTERPRTLQCQAYLLTAERWLRCNGTDEERFPIEEAYATETYGSVLKPSKLPMYIS